jgi:hypothetical protein
MPLDARTAPMPAPPVRQFSFTDWQVNNPTSPPPGDRLDSEFDRANASITDTITWASVTLNSDGSIRDGVVGENNLVSGLFDDVAQGIIDDVQPLVDTAGAYASAAQTSANTALGASNTATAQAGAASGAASQALASQTTAATARDLALGYANAASAFADDAQNAENDATGAAEKASDYATLTQAWAEHMPDTIPPNILAVADVTGDHWSARWWANKAAGAFGALSSLYMGALPGAPGSTPTGDPLPVGAIYYNTTTQQPYVWTGTQWLPFTVPAKAVVIGLVYQASAGQTVFDTNANDLTGNHYPVTADPLEVYVNGVRVPQTEGAFTGDWNNLNNLITFNTPLAAGSIVMIDVLTADTSSGVLPGGPYLALAGGTMIGPLILAGDGTGALQPVTRQQLNTKLNLSGGTLTGALTLPGAPTGANDAATKAYADTKVPLAGGTMTGLLTLSGAPTAANHATTKTYVDTSVATKLNLSGGTLTGDLTLRGPPSTANMAATKGYVDAGVNAALPLAGGTMTGDLILRGSPTSANMAANKAYVDLMLPLAGGTMTGNLNFNSNQIVSWGGNAAVFYDGVSLFMQRPPGRFYMNNAGFTWDQLPSGANSMTLTAAGDLTAAGSVMAGSELRAPATVRLTNTGAYFTSGATVTQLVMDTSLWRLEYTRSTGALQWTRGSDNAALFTIDPSGNVGVQGNANVGGGISMNQAAANASFIADASNVYLCFSAAWGWWWDRSTGRLSYVNNVPRTLLQISENGYGVAYPALGTVYGNFFGFGWDGNIITPAVNGAEQGWLVRSNTSAGAGYQGVWRMEIAPGGAAMHAWYSTTAAVGWAAGTVSDRRTKSNITPAGDGLAAVLAMPVYACDRTLPDFDPRHLDFSVMSDEVAAQVPSMVIKSDDPNIFDMIDPLVADALLIKAVQQLAARVTALEGAVLA